CARGAVSDYW
nr:immunoglobulin heavy chain junction region [Macaca mulatta]MOY22129.1 immunoglobulin heavy chain junction region [Macaca mulatta]MOY22303.1 immunoglobulin heavy chain junction region [Macaca mulatta]MOY23497.1 immunoglobulin heavy chain junction region [Macaca mulatta]MOY25494.1 immunoglobulin heavy chain junction region [Macaca mulatta]